jgi:hypothetical protein
MTADEVTRARPAPAARSRRPSVDGDGDPGGCNRRMAQRVTIHAPSHAPARNGRRDAVHRPANCSTATIEKEGAGAPPSLRALGPRLGRVDPPLVRTTHRGPAVRTVGLLGYPHQKARVARLIPLSFDPDDLTRTRRTSAPGGRHAGRPLTIYPACSTRAATCVDQAASRPDSSTLRPTFRRFATVPRLRVALRGFEPKLSVRAGISNPRPSLDLVRR